MTYQNEPNAGNGASQGAPQSPTPAGPPPGWFADPQDPTQQRWWDGIQWTGHTAPAAVAQAVSGGMASASAGGAAGTGMAPAAGTAPVGHPSGAPQKRSRGRMLAVIGGSVAAVALVGFLVFSGVQNAVDGFRASSEVETTEVETSAAEPAPTEDSVEATSEETTAPADQTDTEPETETDTGAASASSVPVGDGGYVIDIPEGWGTSPQAELLEGIFGDSALIEVNGAWASGPAFDANQLMVMSMNVPATREVLEGGFEGAVASGTVGYDDVTVGEVVWTTTADGRTLAYQTITTVGGGITTSTAVAQVEAGSWTVQITAVTLDGTDVTALIDQVARTVVPAG